MSSTAASESNMAKEIVKFDVDYALVLCSRDGADCVYWMTARGRGGYFVTVVVDSGTGSFVETMVEDAGPYSSEREADMAGLDPAAGGVGGQAVEIHPEGPSGPPHRPESPCC